MREASALRLPSRRSSNRHVSTRLRVFIDWVAERFGRLG
jgi:hypothetical protein